MSGLLAALAVADAACLVIFGILAAALLQSVRPREFGAFVVRRHGRESLTDEEVAALTGLVPPPAGRHAVPPVPPVQVPPSRRVIKRKEVPDRPPWETQGNPALKEDR